MLRRILAWLTRTRPPRGGHQSGPRTASRLHPPPDSVSKQVIIIDPAKLIGYQVKGKLYHPADVTIITRED